MLAFQFLISVQVKMGSSSHLITTSMMDSTAKENSSKPKKFSPFSVDSLLATKVKQQNQSDHHPHQGHHLHHQLDNNNTKTEPNSSTNVNKQLISADLSVGNSNSVNLVAGNSNSVNNVVDLSLKKEESTSGNSIAADEDLDLEEEDNCDNDNESELDDDLIDDDDGECDDEGKTPESGIVFGGSGSSPILVPHPRFPALGLNLGLNPHHPTPTSVGWNPVVSHPWMPQFRSPLNPFIPREYFFFVLFS